MIMMALERWQVRAHRVAQARSGTHRRLFRNHSAASRNEQVQITQQISPFACAYFLVDHTADYDDGDIRTRTLLRRIRVDKVAFGFEHTSKYDIKMSRLEYLAHEIPTREIIPVCWIVWPSISSGK